MLKTTKTRRNTDTVEEKTGNSMLTAFQKARRKEIKGHLEKAENATYTNFLFEDEIAWLESCGCHVETPNEGVDDMAAITSQLMLLSNRSWKDILAFYWENLREIYALSDFLSIFFFYKLGMRLVIVSW